MSTDQLIMNTIRILLQLDREKIHLVYWFALHMTGGGRKGNAVPHE